MLLACLVLASVGAQAPVTLEPGRRVLLDAHNAYPYQGRWADRLDRALATGLPIAIEQDLVWRPTTPERPAHSIVSHGAPFTGREPTLRDVLEHIRPYIQEKGSDPGNHRFPMVTLNLDFKDSEPAHFDAIWNLLGEYERWLTTAPRTGDVRVVQPLTPGPLLVLTGADPAQRIAFHDQLPVGTRLRLFGAVPSGEAAATNYLRWSNNPWSAVEPEGQNRAAEWTTEDAARLTRLTRRAHESGLWIRFYTLNGHSREEGERMGWSPGYNLGSLEAAHIRWRAAITAGVDFIATDQYEELARISPR